MKWITDIISASLPLFSGAYDDTCAIRVELNDSVVVPYTFDPNDVVSVRAEGEVTWYRRGDHEMSSGPDGIYVDRAALKLETTFLGYLDPPLDSANDGALLAELSSGTTLIGSGDEVTLPMDGTLKLKVNDAWGIDNRGAFSVVVGREPLEPTYDLAGEVERNQGLIPYDFVARFGKYHWSEKRNTEEGHAYLSVVPLGRYSLPVEEVAAVFRQRVTDVFPMSNVGSLGPEVVPGNQFHLMFDRLGFQVNTDAVTPYSFTFRALSFHILKGTAIHGIFRDSTGYYWMFQQGRGEKGETLEHQVFNLNLAPMMWQSVGSKLDEILTEMDATPGD